MSRLEDGTIVQDGLNVYRRNHGKGLQLSPYPTKAIVTSVYYSDDKNNADEDCVLCDLHVVRYGLDLFGVPFYLDKCSADNFVDYRPVEVSRNVDVQEGKEDPAFDKSKIDVKKMNGDMVLVVFIDGDPQQATIIKMVPHTQSGKNGKCPNPREGRVAGDHYRIRMNGMEFKIDKDGYMSIKSAKTLNKIPPNKKISIDLSVLKNDPNVPDDQKQSIKIEIDNTENAPKITATITDNTDDQKKQIFEMDGTGHKVSITNQHPDGENKIELSQTGLALTILGDTTLTLDGKLTATVTGEAKIHSDEKAIIDAPKVELTEGAAEAVVKGNAFKDLYNAHTHGTGVGPSGPPVIQMELAPGSHLSTKVTTG